MINLGNGTSGEDNLITDGSDATFMQDVIEASQETPVIVDFWAPWCGPCKQLGPALEQSVKAAGGKIKMVKINIDEHPAVAGQLRVQSIPAVFGFAGGRPVDGFMGMKPPSEITEFIHKMIEAGGGDPQAEKLTAVLDAADLAVENGEHGEAMQAYMKVLEVEGDNLRAIAGLGKCYIQLEELEAAREMLDELTDEHKADPVIVSVLAALSLAEAAGDVGEADTLRAVLDKNPNDHQARYDLALALMGAQDNSGALDELLELFRRDREWNDEAARTQMMTLFDSLAPTDPLIKSGRRRLGSMVFV